MAQGSRGASTRRSMHRPGNREYIGALYRHCISQRGKCQRAGILPCIQGPSPSKKIDTRPRAPTMEQCCKGASSSTPRGLLAPAAAGGQVRCRVPLTAPTPPPPSGPPLQATGDAPGQGAFGGRQLTLAARVRLRATIQTPRIVTSPDARLRAARRRSGNRFLNFNPSILPSSS